MRKLLVMLVVLAACRTAPPTPTGAVYGTASPRAAVETFLAAIRAGDLQAISYVWGNERGSVIGQMDRAEMERRQLIFQCYFNHDQARVLEQVSAGEPNHTVFRAELTLRGMTRTPTVSTVQGPQGRWYVVDADINAVRDFCRPAPGQPR